jgi:hypothetical protein
MAFTGNTWFLWWFISSTFNYIRFLSWLQWIGAEHSYCICASLEYYWYCFYFFVGGFGKFVVSCARHVYCFCCSIQMLLNFTESSTDESEYISLLPGLNHNYRTLWSDCYARTIFFPLIIYDRNCGDLFADVEKKQVCFRRSF